MQGKVVQRKKKIVLARRLLGRTIEGGLSGEKSKMDICGKGRRSTKGVAKEKENILNCNIGWNCLGL